MTSVKKTLQSLYWMLWPQTTKNIKSMGILHWWTDRKTQTDRLTARNRQRKQPHNAKSQDANRHLEFSESSCVPSTSHTNKIFCLKLSSSSFSFSTALKLWCLGHIHRLGTDSSSSLWSVQKENSCKTPEDEVRGRRPCFYCTFFSIRACSRFR